MSVDISAPARKRSVILSGHATSITLEDPFWAALKSLAQKKGVTVTTLINQVDRTRGQNTLSSAVRLFILGALQDTHNNKPH
ncbi:MAG: ribbon-helix-helix domain-containing protein [Alphaproteobacteria bacterium]|nr:ribbon-helix-helix domain-containing protein [Alphaproteobacteria bacterium]